MNSDRGSSGPDRLGHHTMLIIRRPMMVAIILALSAGWVQADPITYVETGTMSGSINGMLFSDAAVTITTVADTANITFTNNPGGVPTFENAGVTTIQIAGVGTATFTGDTIGAFSEDLSVFTPGLEGVGITDLTAQVSLLGNLANGPPFYDLSTSFSATASGFTGGGGFMTTLGELAIASVSGDATFTATLSPAVPEPSSLALCGIAGFVGLGCARARHKRLAIY
jgi:hypothetical protein